MRKQLLIIIMLLQASFAMAEVVGGINYTLNPSARTAYVSKASYSGSIVIPSTFELSDIKYTVTSIEESAFKNCKNLISITIPNSVTEIGKEAFQGCTGLTSITLPKGILIINRSVFAGCTGLTSIDIPNSVTLIDELAFYGCTGLTSIDIPNSVTSIEWQAFYGCTGLTSIKIPNSVTYIGVHAFEGCTGLTSIDIPNSLTSLSGFPGCTGLTSINIPNSVTSLSGFSGCTGLTSIDIPNSVTSIGTYAFEGCSNLKTIYCYCEEPPSGSIGSDSSLYETAILYVPENSVELYQKANAWRKFKTILGFNAGGGESRQKCSKPTISYRNGQLTFESETAGVTFQSKITDSDISSYTSSEVRLGVTYVISVYASKTGYDDSDVATASLCWIDAEPHAEGITNGVANVRANAVLIQSAGNTLNIEGPAEGTEISVYNMAGQKVGSARATSGITRISTSLTAGEVGIVKFGQKAVKVVMK